MTQYVYMFSDGDKDQKDLLGGKGANLAEMVKLGLPVPPGFTISTDACRAYLSEGKVPPEVRVEVTRRLREVEDHIDRTLGDSEEPLLLSVRSGAKFSMPGMMETVLNVGLNDDTVHALADFAGDERFAWDSYRRLIQMFGKTVLDIDSELFSEALDARKSEAGVTSDVELDVEQLRTLVKEYKAIVEDATGKPFPQTPRKQLDMAIEAVFRSWNTERAMLYRRRERIPDDLGTAVNVQAMVFGNLGETSGTGVCFTRDPSSGHSGVYGDYLPNAQGEDVVAGIRNTLALSDLKERDRDAYRELRSAMRRLETHYRDLCDIEFTIERGKLWMLQTRVGKRTAAAAFRVATQLVDEQLITMDEALERVTGEQLTNLLFPQFDKDAVRQLLATGMGASPGAAVGAVAFDNASATAKAAEGVDVVLVRRETSPEDLPGMIAAQGVLTARGGKTSHAAVVARGMGMCAVVGAEDLQIDVAKKTITVGETVVSEGDVISIDGKTGQIYLGAVDVIDSPVMTYIADGLEAAQAKAEDDDTRELVAAVDRLLQHADARRRLRVRTNADTGEDAQRARDRGAEGIGLCRTEHQFLGERREYIERVILAEDDEARASVMAELLPLQRADFVELLTVMDGLPATIRLIDPPLHEFLPDLTELTVKVELAKARGEEGPELERDKVLLEAVRATHEQNPMLGLRGVRLGLKYPGLFALQIRAIAEAVVELRGQGKDPQPEIMVPLIGSRRELHLVREQGLEILQEVGEAAGMTLDLPIGCMIELPRAALTAERIAHEADFFSFGTNDLTQTTWGFSRDDVETEFFTTYMENGVLAVSPFETLDGIGVGELVRQGVAGGRKTKPSLKTGVCGEHGGDPESIHFFHEVGLDYVSCSPFRVPVARLEAGRAAAMNGVGSSTA
ncbi:pyruvate, phosphate dikinase [Janibacter melonis]|uniref:Pyruvate, phosphate dikinase n=1 Tax=Janibacter melonis TaxID=262209 RepID=A0A176QGH2_9MICO|nr:pyruvate, phosphate dikinase [Janibacter melonis]MBD5830391.1 pyruvate, phosphate dikinase [Janibacter melonis]OAB88915.1 pyruvate, phosphate dikinase [Janibacter melonis]